jgi:hypothetical protein
MGARIEIAPFGERAQLPSDYFMMMEDAGCATGVAPEHGELGGEGAQPPATKTII